MKKRLSLVMACILSVSLIFPGMGELSSAKIKKPKLNKKKITVYVKQKKKLKIKTTKGIKKTTWSIKSKKIAKLSKRKKGSVVIKGVKKGKTTVTAKVKIKKKVYKLKCKVTVKAKGGITPSVKPSITPSVKPSIKPSNKPTDKPTDVPASLPSSSPSASPSATPSPTPSPTPTPTPTPRPVIPEGSRYEVKALEKNQWKAIGEEYYSGLVFDAAEGSAFYKMPEGENQKIGNVGFLLNEQGKNIDVSDFDTVEIKLEAASGQSATKQSVSAKFYTGDAKGYEDGITVRMSYYGNECQRVQEIPISDLVKAGISLDCIKAISIVPTSTANFGSNGIKVYSIAFVKKEGAEYVSKDTPKAIKVTNQYGSSASFNLKVGDTVQLKAQITNKNTEVLNHKVVWSSSDETIATVAEDGTVKGINASDDSVTITASAEGYSDVTSTIHVEVYDDTPKSVRVQAGNYSMYSLEELKRGIPVKNLLLNANDDVVGEADDQEITVTGSNVTAVIENGMLKATAMSKTRGTISMEATNAGELIAPLTRINVYEVGYHALITAENMYCVCEGKKASDIVVSENIAMVKDLSNQNSGIGFKCSLPAGKTIGDYDGVSIYASAPNAESNYPAVSLYMPKNGWETDIAAPVNGEWENAKSACKNTGDFKKAGGITSFTFNEVTTEEKTSNKANFALKFIVGQGNIAIHEIFFFKN